MFNRNLYLIGITIVLKSSGYVRESIGFDIFWCRKVFFERLKYELLWGYRGMFFLGNF